jgi:hypothetical protein
MILLCHPLIFSLCHINDTPIGIATDNNPLLMTIGENHGFKIRVCLAVKLACKLNFVQGIAAPGVVAQDVARHLLEIGSIHLWKYWTVTRIRPVFSRPVFPADALEVGQFPASRGN